MQDFYPTPGTISTCMFWTGLNPYTMEPVYVPRTPQEKAEQRALLQYYLPDNHPKIRAALIRAGRRDLIGSGPNCLVPADPRAPKRETRGKDQPPRKEARHPLRNTKQKKKKKNR